MAIQLARVIKSTSSANFNMRAESASIKLIVASFAPPFSRTQALGVARAVVRVQMISKIMILTIVE
eukprot:5249923-Pyramimonas_sp.AAC.1